jgi:hypothetical protein
VIAIALWVGGALLAARLWRKVRSSPDKNNEVRA